MTRYTLNGRPVEVTETLFEMNEGCEAIDAYFEDTGTPLTDEELERFNGESADELYSNGVENAMSRAYDLYKDSRD